MEDVGEERRIVVLLIICTASDVSIGLEREDCL